MMKKLFYIGALSTLLLVACGEVKKPIPEDKTIEYPKQSDKNAVPKYKIEEDDFGKGMWKVTLSTSSTDEKELKALVEETKT